MTQVEDSMVPLIKGMLKRGDRQQDIATFFGINAGRIAEINTGQRFADAQAANGALPPPGPYPSAYEEWRQGVANDKRAAWDTELQEVIEDFVLDANKGVQNTLSELLLDMTNWDIQYGNGRTPKEALNKMIKHFLCRLVQEDKVG